MSRRLHRTGGALALLCLPFTLLAAPADADLPGATLAGLIEWAETRNPELAVAGHELDAAEAMVGSADALPDPSFSIEWRDIDADRLTLDPSRVGSTKYTFAQTFPLWGKRGLQADIARAEAERARRQRSSVSVELRARLSAAHAERWQVRELLRLNAEQRSLLRDLERIATARYADGLTAQSDAIRAQTECTQLETERVRLEAERRRLGAQLNALLGRRPDAPLADPVALSPLPAPAGFDGLQPRLLAANPRLAAQAAAVEAAGHTRELALAKRLPDVTFGVSPVQRGSRLDGWEVMLAINIPLDQDARRADVQASAARLAAAEAGQVALALELQQSLAGTLAAYEAAGEQERLLRTRLRPQAEAALRSALAGYRSGRDDFTTLLEAERQTRSARAEHLRAQVEQRLRVAELERLVGEPL
ncbi:MAG: TolC family protein [Proteobacteria bacterium]|nr:TolC family protein [Pseudomonadota bacterium]